MNAKCVALKIKRLDESAGRLCVKIPDHCRNQIFDIISDSPNWSTNENLNHLIDNVLIVSGVPLVQALSIALSTMDQEGDFEEV